MGKASVYDRGPCGQAPSVEDCTPESCQRRLAVDTVVLDAVPSVSRGRAIKQRGYIVAVLQRHRSIFAQCTNWAVAVTQAFLAALTLSMLVACWLSAFLSD